MSWKSFINFLIRSGLWLGERLSALVRLIGRLIWAAGHAIYVFGLTWQRRFLDRMEARDD